MIKKLIDRLETKVACLISPALKESYKFDLEFNFGEIDYYLSTLEKLSSNDYESDLMDIFKESIGNYLHSSFPRFKQILETWSSEDVIDKLDRKYEKLKHEYNSIFDK